MMKYKLCRLPGKCEADFSKMKFNMRKVSRLVDWTENQMKIWFERFKSIRLIKLVDKRMSLSRDFQFNKFQIDGPISSLEKLSPASRGLKCIAYISFMTNFRESSCNNRFLSFPWRLCLSDLRILNLSFHDKILKEKWSPEFHASQHQRWWRLPLSSLVG